MFIPYNKINVCMERLPYQFLDWNETEEVKGNGLQGFWKEKTILLGKIRLRLVTYSEGFIADHWCTKGHVIHCIEGEVDIEFKDGKPVRLEKGEGVFLTDERTTHRSLSSLGGKLFIMDGEFLH